MYSLTKRLFDVTVSSIVLFLFSPLLLACAIAVKLDSPGPVFYRGVRTGRNGRLFKMLKFRTMVDNAERIGGPSTGRNDPRITRAGGFLRRYKLDELPQFMNVLMGDMSIVGPRPEIPEYTNWYTEEERIILTVPPGITDYASLKFVNLGEVLGDENVDRVYENQVRPEKNKLRIRYVVERSTLVDIRILFATLLTVLRRQPWNM